MLRIDNLELELTRETRVQLVPGKKTRQVSIIGMDGAYILGSKYKPREIELQFHLYGTEQELLDLKDQVAGVFGDLKPKKIDLNGNVYYARYSGGSNIEDWIYDALVTVPLILANPYRYGPIKTQEGNGTIENMGSEPIYLEISILGPAEDIQIKIGDTELKYTGILTQGEILIIDESSAIVGAQNKLSLLEGTPILIPPGSILVTCSASATWSWREKWII